MLELSDFPCIDLLHAGGNARGRRLADAPSWVRGVALILIVFAAGLVSAEPPAQTAPGVPSPGSTAPATPASKALEQELQQFAKLPVDKGIEAYSKALTQMREVEDEYERRWIENDRDFHVRSNSEFKKRVPAELAEAFKRMTDRSARHAWVVALSKVPDAKREAASAKDAEQREQIWAVRGQFENELNQGKIPALNQMGQRLQEQETKLRAHWVRVYKMEAILFPRMSREDILEVRKWPAFNALAEETKVLQLSEEVSAILKKAGEQDEDAWVPPELQAELANWRDPEGFSNRQFEINHIEDSKARETAKVKYSEDRDKLKDIFLALRREENKNGFSLTTLADWHTAPAQTQKDWHRVKAIRYGARLKKIEDTLARKSSD